eukprot:CAMPEP_0179222434 /NCGR_PEP_ID=MMETSP0797-20121207/6716_1 /TAXON_ID=47934 /ORGANISM="Dinophysis acuminata, Strain DAEP01" /LENGTH=175 /DNA_ID=CAMNT_0020929271 /DNA_START=10 /DNA_END=537 /DNA_ORIENTATION=+
MAFGGSRTWETIFYADQLVLPLRPRMLVYYCGSNDINYYTTQRDDLDDSEIAARIYGHVHRFKELLHRVDPNIVLVFCSIIRAPQKRDKWNIVNDANRQIERMCRHSALCHYVDLHDELEVPPRSHKPRPGIYLQDQLHYKRSAYSHFRDALKGPTSSLWGGLAPGTPSPNLSLL